MKALIMYVCLEAFNFIGQYTKYVLVRYVFQQWQKKIKTDKALFILPPITVFPCGDILQI